MPYNGTGLFQRIYSWVADAAVPLNIDATRMDTDTDDIASGLSNCVTRDGQSTWLADLPAGNFKITGLGSGSASEDSVNYGQVFNSPAFTTPTIVANPALTDNSLLIPSTSWVQQIAFQTVLPGQGGHANELLTTDGTNASFSPLLKSSTIRWADSTDITKLLAFDVSLISTGTTRTITFPNTNVVLNQYMKVSDQKASGTNGGSSLSSDITQTRTLNTVDVNTISGASLASDTVTLPAGTYICSGKSSTGGVVGGSKIFLYNTTDSTYTLIGVNGSQAANGPTYPELSGQFTIAGTKNFKLRHWTGNAVATTGLGVAAASGQVEVYSELEFWRIA